MRNDLRDTAAVEVKSRVLSACLRQAELPDGLPLDVLVNETLYLEKRRLEQHQGTPGWSSDAAFWDRVKTRLGRANEAELRTLLAEIVERYVEEVTGNFNPTVYKASTTVLPRALPLLLNAMSPKRLAAAGTLPRMEESIHVQGHVEHARKLHDKGTLILAPTHVSNLDSVVVGWALYAMGLPPFTYGAGLNLFSNPVLSFFMHNLGAYRVDRLKKAPVYKDVLKEYATISLELGQSNLFFPAGTRVRSGEVEQRLKLGLLSSGLRAFVNNKRKARARPNIYIVPCTLNYHLVLEASTLIDDHLKAIGKSRYIITDDESSRPRTILKFMRSVVNLDSRITVTLAEPLDVFGNRVDEDGQSLDERGRPIDVGRYVLGPDGSPVHAPQRDRVFTQQSGEAIASAFRRHNVVLSTNLTAFCLFKHLRASHRGMDLYRLLRTAGDGTGVEFGVLAGRVREALEQLRDLEDAGRIRLDPELDRRDASRVVADALRHFGSYHGTPVMVRRGDRIFAEDMNLLLYYHNRLKGYGLEVGRSSHPEAA